MTWVSDDEEVGLPLRKGVKTPGRFFRRFDRAVRKMCVRLGMPEAEVTSRHYMSISELLVYANLPADMIRVRLPGEGRVTARQAANALFLEYARWRASR